MLNLSNRITAGAKLVVAAHFLLGVTDTMSSQTDTVISAILLALACFFYAFSVNAGEHVCQNFSALSAAFSVHALLEADIFTNTFIWVATGFILLTIVNGFTSYNFEATTGRLAFEGIATYAVALVSFVKDENAVLTKGLGFLLGATSLLVFFATMITDNEHRGDKLYSFAPTGNQVAFGASVIAHASYYVLLEENDKTVYAQFVALAVAVSMSSVGIIGFS